MMRNWPCLSSLLLWVVFLGCKGKGNVLVNYCCIICYHKIIGLKQHTFIISVSVGQESGHSVTGFSLFKVFQGCSQCAGWAVFSSGSLTREEFASELIQIVGRIHLLPAGGLRSLFFHWLLVEYHPPLLEAACSSLPCGLPHRTSQNTAAYFFKASKGRVFYSSLLRLSLI